MDLSTLTKVQPSSEEKNVMKHTHSNADNKNVVFVLHPSNNLILVDWNDTIGVYLCGEKFIPYNESLKSYILFLLLAIFGVILLFLSYFKAIHPLFSVLGIAFGTPHMIFDMLLWQQKIAFAILLNLRQVPEILNDLIFLGVFVGGYCTDCETIESLPPLLLSFAIVLCNICVRFYDAINPSISRIGIVLALCILIVFYGALLVGFYSGTLDIPSYSLTLFSALDVNAGSLIFSCLNHMILCVLLQLITKIRQPHNTAFIRSGMEFRMMEKEKFDNYAKQSYKL
jgi:hypothetical protein